jgi:anti-sigma regulatory factor (Ser/Thr protein kinase)
VAKELADGRSGIVLDLTGVELADRLGLIVVPTLARRAERDHGVRVVAAAAPATQARLRSLAADFIDVFDSVARASAALRRDRHPRSFRLTLPADATAAMQARKVVEHACQSWRQDQLAGAAQIVVNELVCNAVRHGQPPLELSISRRKRHLHIRVADGADETPALLGPAHVGTGRGLGLLLVEALTEAWGCHQTPTGKIVWAVLGPTD